MNMLIDIDHVKEPMSQTERAWLPPYVVLIINDNLYGLICALSYICSVGPLACFELHMLESRLKEEKIIC